MKRLLLLSAFVLAAATAPGSAHAQGYAELTYGNVLKTLARFDALQIQSDTVLDDYAKLNDCDNFFKNYRNDFAMQERRKQLRDQIKQERGEYPDAYYFTTPMKLGRYDFKTRLFKLEEKSRLVNINSFLLVTLKGRGACVKDEKLQMMPEEIGAVLDQPVTLEGLPISEEQSKALVERMNKDKNFDRVIYARFSLMIVYAPPMDVVLKVGRYNADAQLLSIEFFEDKKMTKPIWIYTRA